LLVAVGLGFLAYGAVLAWHTHAATAVLAVGTLFSFLALVLPSDWSKLALNFPGGSVEVERARAAQDILLSLPHSAQDQLNGEALVAEIADQAPEQVGAGAVDN